MKKLLTILGSVGLIATTSAAVVACGDKMPKNAEKKETKQEKKEQKVEKAVEKKEEGEKFPKQNLDLGAFFKNEGRYNSFSQYEIKNKIAKLTNTDISTLTDLNIEYEDEKGTGTVKSTKYTDTLNFSFSNILDLGEFKKENKTVVPQLEVKEKLAKTLKHEEKDLVGLEVTYGEKEGNGTVKSAKTRGTLKFKFTIK
ncbi:lipoprotein [Mycoplasma feriruminatoris]|uniref:Lipoprotein n=2 Tax=Mycoplasma feriruminatoris TaxID=1179777 RepID=A0A654IC48_9MOLU|nr:lipoprotein [Mycoplasma feriruminatoris]UKS54555.1 putative lipoprotein [Mycoplasma feriruminatoris]VZK65735.1 hypothetical protein MF5292_00914 [Mycoplasma feriruminatoris]VZR75876.1 hypothetical protein MF5294_00910 [Mycoplasma feriruminatoris]VZR98690.1 hypothetical protein MF5293_00908 [Mycoplasma feriruminatoris]